MFNYIHIYLHINNIGRNEFLKKQINGLILSSEYPVDYFNQNMDPNNGYPPVNPRNNSHPTYLQREQSEYQNFVGDDKRDEPGRVQGTFCVFMCIYIYIWGISCIVLLCP
jgi:hypothetical protein